MLVTSVVFVGCSIPVLPSVIRGPNGEGRMLIPASVKRVRIPKGSVEEQVSN